MDFDFSIAEVHARRVLEELGLDNPADMPISDITLGRGAFYEEKDLEKIAKYCKKDVITLARVYNRFAGTGNLNDDDIIFV